MLGFPLGKVGGLLTFVENIKYGLEELNHTVDCYAITTNKRKKPEKNAYNFKKILGFETEEWQQEYSVVVNKYDLIIFIHSCPHLLKSYNHKVWEKCYSLIKDKPILTWIHDSYYEKYYPWFNNIPLKYNVKIVCPYDFMYSSSSNLRAMKIIIDNPFKINSPGLYTKDKKNYIVDHNNWKGVRHKELLLKYANEINGKIISFGEEGSFDFRMAKKHNNFNKIIHKGWQKKDYIYNYLKKAKVFTNFVRGKRIPTTWGYAITEAISYGCIPVMQTPVDKNHKITCIKVNSHDEIPQAINKIIKNFKNYNSGRVQNLELIKKVKPIEIARQVLEYVKMPYKETKKHNWW